MAGSSPPRSVGDGGGSGVYQGVCAHRGRCHFHIRAAFPDDNIDHPGGVVEAFQAVSLLSRPNPPWRAVETPGTRCSRGRRTSGGTPALAMVPRRARWTVLARVLSRIAGGLHGGSEPGPGCQDGGRQGRGEANAAIVDHVSTAVSNAGRTAARLPFSEIISTLLNRSVHGHRVRVRRFQAPGRCRCRSPRCRRIPPRCRSIRPLIQFARGTAAFIMVHRHSSRRLWTVRHRCRSPGRPRTARGRGRERPGKKGVLAARA